MGAAITFLVKLVKQNKHADIHKDNNANKLADEQQKNITVDEPNLNNKENNQIIKDESIIDITDNIP